MAKERFVQIRLTDEQYAILQDEAADMDRPISWVARRRMFTPGSEVPIEQRPTKVARAGRVTFPGTPQDIAGGGSNPFGSPQAESAVASDEATAVITRDKQRYEDAVRAVTDTKPKRQAEPKSIDQERLERMNATKYGKRK